MVRGGPEARLHEVPEGFTRVPPGFHKRSARVSQSVPQELWERFHIVTAKDCTVGLRSGTVGRIFAHPKQNRRCAMIGGLDRWIVSGAALGPEHKKRAPGSFGCLFTTKTGSQTHSVGAAKPQQVVAHMLRVGEGSQRKASDRRQRPSPELGQWHGRRPSRDKLRKSRHLVKA